MRRTPSPISSQALVPSDDNGLADPYVKLSLANASAQTEIVKASLNPIWYQPLVLARASDPRGLLHAKLGCAASLACSTLLLTAPSCLPCCTPFPLTHLQRLFPV